MPPAAAVPGTGSGRPRRRQETGDDVWARAPVTEQEGGVSDVVSAAAVGESSALYLPRPSALALVVIVVQCIGP